MSDELKALVDKFLCWKLPQHFAPDCGISFDGRKDDEWNKNKTWPTGTNLFTADQAEAMLRDIGVAALIEKNARLERHAEAIMAHAGAMRLWIGANFQFIESETGREAGITLVTLFDAYKARADAEFPRKESVSVTVTNAPVTFGSVMKKEDSNGD